MSFWIDPVNYISQWLSSLLLGWGLSPELVMFILYFIGAALICTGAMILVIFLIWAERKIIGRVQDRIGPNRVGPWGIFQTFADMLKIFTKEHITPEGADLIPYNLGPIMAVAAVLMVWAVIPFTMSVVGVDFSVAVLYIMAVGSLGEMAVILAGWGSNNKYAMLASFRSVAILISYEVPMLMAILIPVMLAGSASLQTITMKQDVWYIWMAPLAAVIFLISSIAEVGRAPFDLVESESELVSGFNIEYSGLKFGFFYVADFLHAFTISLLFAVLFLGGWRGPGSEQLPMLGFIWLMIKTVVVWFLIVLLRAALPRFRIDQMMDLNWKFLTPIALTVVMLTALVDKALAGQALFVRVGALFILNILLFYVADRILGHFESRRPRRVVTDKPRPVARYERSDSGV